MSQTHLYKAKKYGEGDGALYKSVTAHSLECAVLGKTWLEESPSMLSAFEFSKKDLRADFVAANLVLHDNGKNSWKFQVRMVPEEKEAALSHLASIYPGVDFVEKKDFPYMHDLVYGFDYEAENQPAQAFFASIDFFEEKFEKWIMESMRHHDRRVSEYMKNLFDTWKPKKLHRTLAERYDADAILKIHEMCESVFPEVLSTIPSSEPLYIIESNSFFKGFAATCDWMVSNENYFKGTRLPFLEMSRADTDPAAYAAELRGECLGVLRACGVLSKKLSVGGWKTLFGDSLSPRGIQKANLPEDKRNRLFIIEAQPGSGKTEIAISVVSEIIAAGNADGIVFALPSQVTSNAIYPRIAVVTPSGKSITETIFPEGGTPTLIHANARRNDCFADVVSDEDFPEFLLSSSKRSMLGSFVACTIDQALMAALPVKHGCVRTLALLKNVLVVDEAHSYDAYMNTLLDLVLEAMSKAGKSVVVLSATLPERRRKEIIETWCNAGKTDDEDMKYVASSLSSDYPLVTVVEGARKILENPSLFKAPFFHIPSPDADPEKKYLLRSVRCPDAEPDGAVVEEAFSRAGRGDVVSIVCNFVDSARETYERVVSFQATSGERPAVVPDIFHARYLLWNRLSIEGRILKKYGSGRRPGEGGILIGTQVLEQSLNLDYDWLATQICAADALFQRMGRQYRYDFLRRPGQGLPECVVLSPEDDDFGLHPLIYGNLGEDEKRHSMALLWRTRALVESAGTMSFPNDIRRWIDAVYDDSFPGEPDESGNGHLKWLKRGRELRTLALAMGKIEKQFSDTDDIVSKMTRFNNASLQIVLYTRSGDGSFRTLDGKIFSKNDLKYPDKSDLVHMNTVSVPESWRKHIASTITDSAEHFARTKARYVEMVEADENEWLAASGNLKYSVVSGLAKVKE